MSELPASSFKCISIVLPVFNTAQYLKELHTRLKSTLENVHLDFELLMVDDGSPDNSWRVIEELAASDSRVKGIRLSRNFGQHPAIAAGFDNARGDVIVLMDTDLQDRPEDLPGLLQALQPDVDVVYTVKEQAEENFSVRFTSNVYHYVFSRITRTSVPRNIGTYRVFTRKFLNSIQRFAEHNVLFGPLMFYMGYKHVIVSVAREVRKGSPSGYTFSRRLMLAVNSLLSYTDLPHQFLMYMGGSILAGSIVYIGVVLLQYVALGVRLPPGLTMIVLLLVSILGVLMLSLGVIGIYVFRVYQEVLARPRYLMAQSINVAISDGAVHEK